MGDVMSLIRLYKPDNSVKKVVLTSFQIFLGALRHAAEIGVLFGAAEAIRRGLTTLK